MAWLRSLLTLLVLAGACLGCGSDGSEGGDDQAASPPTTVATTAASSTAAGEAEDDGDAEAEDDAGASLDACSLLSEDEAAAVLGGPIVGSGPSSGVGESVCEWEVEGDWSITVSVGSPGTAPDNSFEPDPLFGEPEPVDELGGSGWYLGLGTVDFAARDRRNSVQVVSPGTSGDRDGAVELAVLLRERIEAAAG